MKKLFYSVPNLHIRFVSKRCVNCKTTANSRSKFALTWVGHCQGKHRLLAPDGDSVIPCGQCCKTFSTHAALAVHQSQQHGWKMALRRYAADSVRRVCRNYFARLSPQESRRRWRPSPTGQSQTWGASPAWSQLMEYWQEWRHATQEQLQPALTCLEDLKA